jgi:hypothetical protein
MADSWVSSVETVTPRQIRHEQSSSEEEPRWKRDEEGRIRRQQTYGYLRRATNYWDRWGGMIATDELEAFRLGAISTSPTNGAEAILQESRESLDAKG